MPEQQVRTSRSFCRICTSVCGILVDTVDEQVVRVRGDRDHPMSQGYTCIKGRALPAMHHHPQRIERPLMRTGGSLRPASWELCLDDLGARLREIIDRNGPSSVGIFFGSGLGMDAAGYRMAEALHASIGTPARFSPLTIHGQGVIVRSASGELAGTARVDPGMRRGAVSVPHGHEHANVNVLTSHQQADPLTGMARYSGVPVSVHPAVAT